MDIFLKEFQVGQIRIELSVQEEGECKVMFTAKDADNEILWKTPIMDSEGNVKVYPTVEEAFADAQKRLKIYS